MLSSQRDLFVVVYWAFTNLSFLYGVSNANEKEQTAWDGIMTTNMKYPILGEFEEDQDDLKVNRDPM